MQPKIHFLGVLIIALLSGPRTVRGDSLQGVPSDRIEMGNAFVSAWLQFRKDLDSLPGIDVHPAQFEEWFDRMPEFLLRDAARLGTSHEVVLAAVSRLADHGGKESCRFIADLLRFYETRSIEPVLRAALIRAGDASETNRALRSLESQARIHRVEAAILLAAAKNPQGLAYLRSLVKNGEEYAELAALALGRFGRISDEKLLEKALGRTDSEVFIRAALGEIALRKHFPFHYRSILARNRTIDFHVAPNGMYQAWLIVSHRAVSQGAKSADRFLEVLKETRRAPPYVRTDEELFKRQMAAFQDLWIAVDHRLKTPAIPSWPRRFSDALAAISSAGKKRNPSPDERSARVAATVTVCSILGEKLAYPMLAGPTEQLRVISPFGERILDSNLATSWRTDIRSSLILEPPSGRFIESVMLMVSCPESRSPKTIVISGEEEGGRAWRVTDALSQEARYFQILPVGHVSTKRVTLGPGDKDDAPLCIAELRLRYR